MMFYKRDGHVIELQRSHTETQIPEEACNSQHFNPATLPFTTLITATPRPRQCPHLGRYAVVGFEERQPNSGSAGLVSPREGDVQTPLCTEQQQYHQLVVGCRADDTMEFHSACSAEAISTYSCHGSWEDNGTSYLIASPLSRKSVGARRFCFIYTGAGLRDSSEDRATLLQVSSVTGSCHRNVTKMSSTWTLNLTSYGQCGDSASKTSITLSLLTSLLSVVIVLLVSSCSR